MPAKLTDPLPVVMVTFAGTDAEERLFDYYPDEIHFSSEEFIGLTRSEAVALKGKKDLAYLSS